MDSYKQFIKEALPNLSIHSYKQNEEGWDNVAIIVNDELLFRFRENRNMQCEFH